MSKRFPKEPETASDQSRLIGYARVSTADQSVDMQIAALRKAGVRDENMHCETVSGVKKKRPGLDEALRDARRGDTLVVWKLDRVGRSLLDLLRKLEDMEARGIGFQSLTEGIDTRTPGGKLIMHVMGALAQFERDLIVERTRAGMKAYRERGGRVGLPKKFGQEDVAAMKKMRANGVSVRAIADHFCVHANTIHNYIAGRR